MKILVLSDLHIEFSKNRTFMETVFPWPDASEYDVAVFAGDIHTGLNGVKWARERIPNEKPIIYVPGNHEFYIQAAMTVLQTAFLAENKNNVHILNPGTVVIDGVEFIGATLWSSALLLGYADSRDTIGRYINDFRIVQYDHIERFSVGRMQKINQKEASIIEDMLVASTHKKVVVTHFLPTQGCIAPKYVNDPCSPYFCNDLDDLVSKADAWICGHTHERMLVKDKSGTPIYIHPLGYPNENKEPYVPLIITV